MKASAALRTASSEGLSEGFRSAFTGGLPLFRPDPRRPRTGFPRGRPHAWPRSGSSGGPRVCPRGGGGGGAAFVPPRASPAAAPPSPDSVATSPRGLLARAGGL